MFQSLLCALVLSVTSAPTPAVQAATPTVDQIVAGIVARDKQLVERRKAFNYDVAITREKLGYNNEVTETLHDSVTVVGNNGPSYGTRSEAGDPAQETKKTSREEPFELLKILDHYNYTFDGEETVDGVPCYKIGFTPKPDMPYDNREEKVLNNVSGHIWASIQDYSLIKNEGSLLQPVSVAWIFATLRVMEFHFDAMRMPNGDYGPGRLQYRYLVTFPFGQMSERDTRISSNYRQVGK